MTPDPLTASPGRTPELLLALRSLCEAAVELRVMNYRLSAGLAGRAARPDAEARLRQLGWRIAAVRLREVAAWADRLAGPDDQEEERPDVPVPLRRTIPHD